MNRVRPLVLLVAAALPSCALVSNFDYQEGGSGGSAGASTATSGSAASSSAATASSTASAGGTTSTGTTSASSSSGGGGAGGDGGGGGEGGAIDCHRGDGFEDVDPWVLAFTRVHGQHGGMLYETPPTSWAMDGDRLVFAMVLGDGAGPVEVDGRIIHEGPSGAVLVGSIDDDGVLGPVVDVAPVVDGLGPYVSVEVVVARPGVALVASNSSSTTFELIEVDLCSGDATVLATCTDGITGPHVAADGEGRIAFAFGSYATPACNLPAPCEPLDGSNTLFDAYLWLWDRRVAGEEVCPSLRLHDASESLDEGDQSGQGVNALSFEGETLVAFGVYQATAAGPGTIFEGEAQLTTAGPNRYWHARFEPSEDDVTLEPIETFDMGVWTVGGQHMRAPHEASGGVPSVPTFALTVDLGAGQPAGPFSDALPIAEPQGATDILLATVDARRARSFSRSVGSSAFDMLFGMSATPSGLGIAGLLSGNSVDLGACAEPYAFQLADGDGPIPGSDEGGCAFYARLETDGDVSDSLVIDAEEEDALDVGIAAIELPDGDRLVVGTTTGTVTDLPGAIPVPPEGFSTLYVARVAP